MSSLRRRHITEPRFQYSFARALVRGYAVAALAPSCVFLTVYLAVAKAAAPAMREALLGAMPSAVTWFLAMFLSLAAATFLLGIYISHKFVGPLKRVEGWSARRLLGESAEKPTLRPGDELGGIVAGLANLTPRGDA